MVMAVDFDCIHRLEARRVLSGYVLEPELSDSGVTIASGVDLGQRDERSLRRLAISDELRDKLRPYLGLRKHDAVGFLERRPLDITEHEAAELDVAIKQLMVGSLISKFDAASPVPFEQLESQKQTIIASVAFQYGTGLQSAAPNFWSQIMTGDWAGVLANLQNYGDDYPTRRNTERYLLAEVIEV